MKISHRHVVRAAATSERAPPANRPGEPNRCKVLRAKSHGGLAVPQAIAHRGGEKKKEKWEGWGMDVPGIT